MHKTLIKLQSDTLKNCSKKLLFKVDGMRRPLPCGTHMPAGQTPDQKGKLSYPVMRAQQEERSPSLLSQQQFSQQNATDSLFTVPYRPLPNFCPLCKSTLLSGHLRFCGRPTRGSSWLQTPICNSLLIPSKPVFAV